MPRRKSYWHRIKFGLIHFLPVGGLVLWVGLLAVALISLQKPAPEAVVTHSPAQVPDIRQQTPRQNPRSPPIRQSGKDARDAPAQIESRKPTAKVPHAKAHDATSGRSTARAPGEHPPAKAPRVATRSKAGDDAESRPRPENRVADAPAAPVTHSAQANKPGPTVKTPDKSPPAAKMPPKVSSSHVTRAQFTTGIRNREPVDQVGEVFHTRGKPLRRLYYFTEFSGLSGETVTHEWQHDGRMIAKVSFHVGGNHWRVYSSKKLTSSMVGHWRVIVTDSEGKTIETDSFVYKAP